MIVNVLLHAAIAPFAIAACTAFLCRRMRFSPTIAWAAGVGAGFIAGQFLLATREGAAAAFAMFAGPREAVDWLPYAVLLALGITFLLTYASSTTNRLPVILATTLTIGLPLRLLAGSSYVTLRWSTFEKLLYLALLSATFGLTWLALASASHVGESLRSKIRRGEDSHWRLRPALLIVVAVGSAAAVLLSGAIVYGELCVAVAASIAGVLLISTVYPAIAIGISGTAGVVTSSLASLVVLSCFYASLTPTNAALLLLSVMIAGGWLPEFLRSRPTWQLATLRVALCLVPLAMAIVRCHVAAQDAAYSNPYAV